MKTPIVHSAIPLFILIALISSVKYLYIQHINAVGKPKVTYIPSEKPAESNDKPNFESYNVRQPKTER